MDKQLEHEIDLSARWGGTTLPGVEVPLRRVGTSSPPGRDLLPARWGPRQDDNSSLTRRYRHTP